MVPQTAIDNFNIKETYLKFLQDDPDMTMPIAAIESLVVLLKITQQLIKVLEEATKSLKSSVKNSISLSAGCDLFTRFVLRNIDVYRDWEACKRHLVENGRLFVQRAKQSRQRIAEIGLPFVRDDDVILVHGRSRAVSALLFNASKHYVRFRVYVTEARVSSQGSLMANILRKHGIPVCVIADSAVGLILDKVDKVFFGAEGVAESGGVINHIGSYQIAVLAHNSHKPVYVCAESHKFVRLYPLSPSDIPSDYPLDFTTDQQNIDISKSPQIDFTPHEYVTALITDLGTLTPSGVSEELIKIWFD